MSDVNLRHAAMNSDGPPSGGREISGTDARQGVTLGAVRYVLGISLALALVAFVVLYFTYM